MTALLTCLADALDRLDDRHQRRRLVATSPAPSASLDRDGTRLIDFSSNDYLGLARHPLLAERSAEWAIRHGSGSGASRLVTGTSPEHLAVEARIARFKGTEAALLFASGWQLNAAVLAALLKAAPNMLLFTDRLIHGSLHAGAAGHRQIRFRHNDLDHLEHLLAESDRDRERVQHGWRSGGSRSPDADRAGP
jgi:8-amino-7-oxononanoate synthase